MGTGITKILDEVKSIGAGQGIEINSTNKAFQVVGSTTSGVGSLTVNMEVSCDKKNWITAATASLVLGTAETSGGGYIDAHWIHIRGNVTGISGTGAEATAYIASA